MKVAQDSVTQQPVVASESVSPQAVCLHCGGVVLLRQRKRMNGTVVYFWRHQDNHNRNCNGRSRSG